MVWHNDVIVNIKYKKVKNNDLQIIQMTMQTSNFNIFRHASQDPIPLKVIQCVSNYLNHAFVGVKNTVWKMINIYARKYKVRRNSPELY